MKILVCIDSSGADLQVIERAARLALCFKDVEVGIINVYRTADPSVLDYDGGSMRTEETRRREEAEKALGQAAAVFERYNISPGMLLIKGFPGDEITRVAAEEGYDMIVLGSRRHSGLRKVFLGSVSNYVAQNAKTDVLIIKRRE